MCDYIVRATKCSVSTHVWRDFRVDYDPYDRSGAAEGLNFGRTQSLFIPYNRANNLSK